MHFQMKPKIVLIPYPAQGHVTPMVNLASVLLSHGFYPVVAIPEFIHCQILVTMSSNRDIMFVSIPDGLEKEQVRDFFTIERAMEKLMPIHLERLLREVDEDGSIACVVVDLLASYAIEVATRCGFPVAGFWPAMFATYRLIAAIPDMVRSGLITDTGCPRQDSAGISLSSKQALSTEDLPWLIGTQSSIKARFKFWCRTLHRSTTLPWLLFNSFRHEYSLTDTDDDHVDNDDGVIISEQKLVYFPIGPLGKLCPAKRINPSFWEEDGSCLEWLGQHEPGSVIYVSFGSWVSPIASARIKDLALTLRGLQRPFLWAIGAGWRSALPDGYAESVKKLGKVVPWAPQARVLQHQSVGVFLTHCGWNSITEAIQCGKRLLCYPIAGDQFVNCKFVVEIWGVGVRVCGFGREEVEGGLKKLDSCDMKERLGRLSQRIVGEEADARAKANLVDFVRLLDNRMT